MSGPLVRLWFGTPFRAVCCKRTPPGTYVRPAWKRIGLASLFPPFPRFAFRSQVPLHPCTRFRKWSHGSRCTSRLRMCPVRVRPGRKQTEAFRKSRWKLSGLHRPSGTACFQSRQGDYLAPRPDVVRAGTVCDSVHRYTRGGAFK